MKVGDRIELIDMPFDPLPIPTGSRGTILNITHVEGEAYIDVEWDPEVGRSLSLICPPDTFSIIPKED